MIVVLCFLMMCGVIAMSAAAIAWSQRPEPPKPSPIESPHLISTRDPEFMNFSSNSGYTRSRSSRRESNLGDINDMSTVKIDDFLDNDD